MDNLCINLYIKTALVTLFTVGATIIVVSIPTQAYANELYEVSPLLVNTASRFNNDNWDILPHPTIAEFGIHDDGSSYGMTVTGKLFVQYDVPNDFGIRVQRFEMEDHYHYIVNGEIAYTVKDLSKELALAYATHGDV